MAKIINARIKIKRDTASNWESNNPVLYKGEIIIVDTSNGEVRGKIGDGVKTYTQLPFSDEIVRNLINSNKQAIDNHTKDTNVHVTTSEKDDWNSKASSEIATTNSNGLMSADDKSKLNSLGRVYTGTTTPSNSLGQDGDLYIFVKSQTYQTKIDALEEWKISVLAGQSPVVIES